MIGTSTYKNKVKISNILDGQILDFIHEENPDFNDFLQQYYITEEREFGSTYLVDNLTWLKDIPQYNDLVYTAVPTATLSEIFAFDDVIPVNTTVGFPEEYGLLKIDNEIITYTGKTANSFTGCVRGFSGISDISQGGTSEFLTFSDTDSSGHVAGASVQNLSLVFVLEFYRKYKTQFLPGFEERNFINGVSIQNILSRAKDFYTSKGTDTSLEILFKVLFGKSVDIVKPFNYTISSSDSEWIVTDDMIVKVISGDPLKVEETKVFQGNFDNPTASGTVSNVQELFLGTEKYHKLSFSKEGHFGKFKLGVKTNVTERSLVLSTVNVDSTIGFPDSGSFYYQNERNEWLIATYTSKSENQFFGCEGIIQNGLLENSHIIDGTFLYGYENHDPNKVCVMRITGTVSGPAKNVSNSLYTNKGETIKVKYFGEKMSGPKFDTWLYNNISYLNVEKVNVAIGQTQGNNVILKDPNHFLYKDCIVDVIDYDRRFPTIPITKYERAKIANINGRNLEIIDSSGNPVVLDANRKHQIKKRLQYVSFLDDLAEKTVVPVNLLTNIQNTYTDDDENTYVSFSGYPSYPIDSTNRQISFGSNTITSNTISEAHNFLNGEEIYFDHDTDAGLLLTNGSNLDKGRYYVKVLDSDNFKIALTKSDVDIDRFIDFVGLGVTHKCYITPFKLANEFLANQNNFKKILKTPKDRIIDIGNIRGPVGVQLNGLELYSPILDDFISYGQIDDIDVLNPGQDYDIVQPPSINIIDDNGSGAQVYGRYSGELKDIIVTNGGFDYFDTPAIEIEGGNSINARAEATMKGYIHSISFSDLEGGIARVDLTNDQINLGFAHRFVDGEEVEYIASGTPIGIGSTAVGFDTSRLNSNTIYYIMNKGEKSFSLTVNQDDAIAGINTIDLLAYGTQQHTFESRKIRKIVDRISIVEPGTTFHNKKILVDSQHYPPSDNKDLFKTFVGISTYDSYIYAKNHGFASGDIVQYETTDDQILGLTTVTRYTVTSLDYNKFKLSNAGAVGGRTNLLTYSTNLGIIPEDDNLAHVGWSTGVGSNARTENLTSPFGTTAWTVNDTDTNNDRTQFQQIIEIEPSSTQEYTFSAYIKAGTVNTSEQLFEFYVFFTSIPYAQDDVRGSLLQYNFDTDTLIATAKNETTLSGDQYFGIKPYNIGREILSDGWVRVWGTVYDKLGTHNNMRLRFYTNGRGVSKTGTLGIWGIQLEKGASVSDHILTKNKQVTTDLFGKSEDYKNGKYINLKSVGVGTHTFKYPDISVTIKGSPSIGNTTVIPEYYTAKCYPVIKGNLDGIFIRNGGIGYGVTDVINYTKLPQVKLNVGEKADLRPIITNGEISDIRIAIAGNDYSTPPELKVVGIGTTSGNYAKLKANVSGGKIVSVDIIDRGQKYVDGDTIIQVIPSGYGQKLAANVHKWHINAVNRYSTVLGVADHKDTVQVDSEVRLQNKLASFYCGDEYRELLGDNITNGSEVSQPDHSPIVGWSYDGNPIYGPYGYENPITGIGSITKVESSYALDLVTDSGLRPNINKPNGFFVDDYRYIKGSGDLDEYNGRFTKTPEYPDGIYAYFSTNTSIDKDFPYTTIKHRNIADEFNYDVGIQQTDKYLNSGDYKRNVTPLGISEPYRQYPFLEDPLNTNPKLRVRDTLFGKVKTITPSSPGKNYKVGENLSFNDTSINSNIKEIIGKEIKIIENNNITNNNINFEIINNKVIGITPSPHILGNGDVVEISGITSSYYHNIQGLRTIGVNSTTTFVAVAIAATTTTGISTFIQLDEPTTTGKFKVDDVIQIEAERIKILGLDKVNNRYFVSRGYDNTLGPAHNIDVSAYKLEREFTYDIVGAKLENRNLEEVKVQYFSVNDSVGIGTTYSSVVVGTAGSTNVLKSIPARAIYLPNHKFKTGEKLSLVSYGGTITASKFDSLTPHFNLNDESNLYCVKISDEYIGISTQKLGLTANTLSGLSTSYVYFKEVDSLPMTIGDRIRIEKISDNSVTGLSNKVNTTISLGTNHSMSIGDKIRLNVTPNQPQDVIFKFSKYLNTLVSDPKNAGSSGIGIGTDASTITITNHGFETGDSVLYEVSGAPIGGLENNEIYYVIKISNSIIRLATSYKNATKFPYEYITLFTVGSVGTLSKINPKLNLYKGNILRIDVSDSSLSGYELKFYHDQDFKNLYGDSRTPLNSITQTGIIGDGSTSTRIEIDSKTELPDTIFYRLEDNSIENFVNTDVIDHSTIKIVSTKFNGLHTITAVGNTSITYNSIVGTAETDVYSSYINLGFSTATYSTNSTNELGGISSLNIVNIGNKTKEIPAVTSIGSTTGVSAVIDISVDDIGSINGTEVFNQGWEFSQNKTLEPKSSSYAIIKLKDILTLESVGVATGGQDYTTPPKAIGIGNTNISIKTIVQGNAVTSCEIISNDSGLSEELKIIPITNSNGVNIIGATCSSKVVTLELKAPQGGFTRGMPFSVGDKIFVENVQTIGGATTTLASYNSSSYQYRYFDVTEVNAGDAAANPTVKYSLVGISTLEAGAFDPDYLFGRVIKVQDLASFKPEFTTVNYLDGEKIVIDGGKSIAYVAENGWDPISATLRVTDISGKIDDGDVIVGFLGNARATIENYSTYDFNLKVDSLAESIGFWKDNRNQLNNVTERLHDNNYYQRFSYALRTEVDYDTWKEPVDSLGHISGYKNFADYEIINSKFVGVVGVSSNIEFKVEISSDASVWEQFDYDFVSEQETLAELLSREVQFESKKLTDYIEAKTNKVLIHDDISGQFNGRSITFTGDHKFVSADSNSINIISSTASGTLTPTTGTSYNPTTGVLTIVTTTNHGLSDGDTITINDFALTFTCDKDDHKTYHDYPRRHDPASTSNGSLDNGVLEVDEINSNTFTVNVRGYGSNIGGQIVGLTTFKLKSDNQTILHHEFDPVGIDTVTDVITILNHNFNTGEKLDYYPNTGGNRIGIASTGSPGSGVAATTILPSSVYAIKINNDSIKLAIGKSESYEGVGVAVSFMNVIGIGRTHTLSVPSDQASARTLVSIDNVIQSPLGKKVISVGLSSAITSSSPNVFFNNVSKLSGKTLFQVDDEIFYISSVGVGTSSVDVVRGYMGTTPASHVIGAAVTVLYGDYRIERGDIHFVEAPYGPTGGGDASGIGTGSNALSTKSSFSARSYYRLDDVAVGRTANNNLIVDDISEDFDGSTKKFDLKKDNQFLPVGVNSFFGAVLINNIFQKPFYGDVGSTRKSDYRIVSPVGGGTTIHFLANPDDANDNTDIPRGGRINEFFVGVGSGYQVPTRALADVTIGAGGTITSVGLATHGQGYITPPKVSIAVTYSHYTHKFVSSTLDSINPNSGPNLTPTYAEYNSRTGNLLLSVGSHNLTTSNTVQIANNSLTFQCSRDGFNSNKTYPRTTDPASGQNLGITSFTANTIVVNVGAGAGVGAAFTAVVSAAGTITEIKIANPGIGYTAATDDPKLIIDRPAPYKNIPLYGGSGSGAKMDVVVGTGGSIIDFEISDRGIGYEIGDNLELYGLPNVGIGTSAFNITVKNRYQDKFAAWSFGNFIELDDFSSYFNGFRKSFLLTRTITNKEYYSIVAKEESGITLQNNLLVFLNDVLQKPGVDYEFEGGTRFKFKEAPKGGSKFKIYFYVGSDADVISVDVDPTIKPGDRLILDKWEDNDLNINKGIQDPRIVYELTSSTILETQTYTGVGICSNPDYTRPVRWKKQLSDKVIDSELITKNRVEWTSRTYPVTNIVAPVSASDTTFNVVETYSFNGIDNLTETSNHIKIIDQSDSQVAIATAIINESTETVTSISLTNGGSGYTFVPKVYIQSPNSGGITAQATATVTNGSITGFTIDNAGTEYSTPPLVNIESPKVVEESHNSVSYAGDYGTIVGIKSETSGSNSGVSTTSPALVFDIVPTATSPGADANRTGIVTGQYLVIKGTLFGDGVTSIKEHQDSVVCVGKSFADNVYYVNHYTNVNSTTRRVTCNVTSLVGVSTNIGIHTITGDIGFYSWGTITTSGSRSGESYEFHNQNGLLGIETSAQISRTLQLKQIY